MASIRYAAAVLPLGNKNEYCPQSYQARIQRRSKERIRVDGAEHSNNFCISSLLPEILLQPNEICLISLPSMNKTLLNT